MSAEDAKEEPVAAAVVEAPVAEADAAVVETPTPIDVSKPVPRPDKTDFDAQITTLNDEVQEYNEKLAEVDAKISDAKRSSGGDQSEELREARTTMKSLRERKDVIMRDRQEISASQKAAKASLDTKITAGKSLRADLKYTSAEDIEKRIAELEKKQSTTSMSLKDEKILLKEIDQLKSSKKLVSHLTANNDNISTERKAAQSIGEQLTTKNAELDILKKKIEEQKEILETLNEANSERRAVLPALFKEKDALRKDKLAKVEVIKALRSEFRAKENEYRAHQREIRRLRTEAQMAEETARKTAIDARKKALEAEELKRIPFEEEMELCAFLITYLEKNYGNGGMSKNAAAASAAPETAAVAAAAPSGEFEGMVASGKKANNNDSEEYLNLAKMKGTKKGRGSKKGGLKVTQSINLVPDTLEVFALLSLDAPATLTGVVDTIAQLKAKKLWFGSLERGSVPSIRDKQKVEEAKASQTRPERDPGERPVRFVPVDPAVLAAQAAKKAGPKVAAVAYNAAESNDEAFPSLPGAPAKPVAVVEPVEEVAAEPAVAETTTEEA